MTFTPAKPKRGQKDYYQALQEKEITFVSGNAGSGKSFLALSEAVQHVRDNKSPIKKITIIRPYIFTKSENIGALPGSLDEKVMPFVESIRDNFEELFTTKREIDEMMRCVEFLTLSTLRGRSLHHRFIIVEEAQNVPLRDDGMLTILTRLGKKSRIVVAGDLSQCDIPSRDSGFLEAANALAPLKESQYVEMNDTTCVHRNPAVGKIIEAFQKHRERDF